MEVKITEPDILQRRAVRFICHNDVTLSVKGDGAEVAVKLSDSELQAMHTALGHIIALRGGGNPDGLDKYRQYPGEELYIGPMGKEGHPAGYVTADEYVTYGVSSYADGVRDGKAVSTGKQKDAPTDNIADKRGF